jgi:hypothetical protein
MNSISTCDFFFFVRNGKDHAMLIDRAPRQSGAYGRDASGMPLPEAPIHTVSF